MKEEKQIKAGDVIRCFGYDGLINRRTVSEVYPATKELECEENNEVIPFSDVIEVIHSNGTLEHFNPTKSAITASEVLITHHAEVYGAAMNGVCALSSWTRRDNEGKVISDSICEWIPATNKEIYNWLGY